MEYLFYCLPAALIAGAAFFAAFRAENCAQMLKKEFIRLAVEHEKLREDMEELRELLEDEPLEKRNAEAKREAEFFQGLQNIFDYGGAFTLPSAEGIKHE